MGNLKIKYNRISSLDQSLARQQVNSSRFDRVYNDKISGSISFFQRKEAKKLVAQIDAGEVSEVHINELSRVGRDIIDVLTVCKYFTDRNVNLFIENIGMYSMIDGKPSPTFSMIVSVLSNVSCMERESMLFRQKQGIEIARLSNKYKGRANGTTMTEEQILDKYKVVVRELNAGQSLRRSALLGQCSLGTAQRIQKILLNKKSLVA